MRFLALDFETSDLKDKGPVTLGLAIMEDGEVMKSKEWLFKPIKDWKGNLRFNYSENAVQIHGKSLAIMEADGIPEHQIYAEVLEFLGGSIWSNPIVSHNSSFDAETWSNFIYVLGTYDRDVKVPIPKQEILTGPWICTRRIAQSKCYVPHVVPNLKLDTLCQHFGLGAQGDVHGAEADAILAGRLYLALRSKAEEVEG